MSASPPTDHLQSVEVETGPAPSAAVLWLHGLGADGNDFVPIVPELGLSTPVRFVFPHAPIRPVTINGGMAMRAWYDIVSLDHDRDADGAGIRASATQIEALIAREVARGIPADRIVLAGFSMGGAMALHVGVRHAQRLAGVVALSCYLPLAGSLAAEASPANAATPFLICHGSRDPMVPIGFGDASAKALSAAGYPVDWRTYPVEHGVTPDEIADIGAFLGKVLA